MKLKKITDKHWVNVGDGNILSIIDMSVKVNSETHHRTRINFVGDTYLEVSRQASYLVRDLVDEEFS